MQELGVDPELVVYVKPLLNKKQNKMEDLFDQKFFAKQKFSRKLKVMMLFIT